MPTYTVENIPKGQRAKVFDANGDQVLWVVECNTETGEVLQLARTKDDSRFVVAPSGDRLERIRRTFPAPLRVVFHG